MQTKGEDGRVSIDPICSAHVGDPQGDRCRSRSRSDRPTEESMITSFARPKRLAVATCSAAVLGFSLLVAGCGSSSSSSSSAATSQASSSSASTSQSGGQSVTIGIDPTTMPYGGKAGSQLIGMDPAVARAIAKQAGLNASLSEVTFDNAVPALRAGRVEISFVGGWFDDATRWSQMNVVSYYQAAVGFVVQKGNPKNVSATWQGRCGLTLATYTSSPDYLKILHGDSDKCTKAGKKPITVRSFAGLAQGVLAVRSGRIDGMMDAVPAVAYQAHVSPNLSFVEATDQPKIVWGIGVRKQDTALAAQVAKALTAMTASGELAKIWAKYGLPASMNLKQITVNGKPAA